MKLLLRLLLVIVFVGGVWASPLALILFPPDEAALEAEFRRAGERPKLSLEREVLERFPAEFDAWYKDAFGLRPRLIRAHNRAKWLGLSSSPTDQVIPGREGWIFSTWGEANMTWSGLLPMTEPKLESWRRMLELRAAYLEEHGAEFLYIIVPSKNVLYPELMPERFRQMGPTRREQFLDHVTGHVPVLDLLPALKADRERGESATYYQLGDHWTDLGAHAGCRAVIGRLGEMFPVLVPVELDDLIVERGSGPGDSWAGRLYLQDELDQTFDSARPRQRRASVRDEGNLKIYETDLEETPRCLIFHDSFGDNFVPLFAEHFSALGAVKGPFDTMYVEQFQPDVVVEMWVDRNFINETPALGGDEAQELLEEAFAASDEVLIAWDAVANEPAIDALGETPMVMSESGLIVQTAGAGDFLELPEFVLDAGSSVILLIEISSPMRTMMHLAYRTQSERELARERSFRVQLHPGRNRVLMHIDVEELFGRLVLRPGLKSGNYVIHELAARAVQGEL